MIDHNPTPFDVAWIANNLRPCERDEIRATSDISPAEFVIQSYADAEVCRLAKNAMGEPVSLWGIIRDADYGITFMASTPRVKSAGLLVARGVKKTMREFRDQFSAYRMIETMRNDQHNRFIEFAGFSVTGWEDGTAEVEA